MLASAKIWIILGNTIHWVAASQPDIIRLTNVSYAVARRLSTSVSAGSGLQAAINELPAGGVLELGSGTFTGSYNSYTSFYIDKDITIRAQTSGQAILDGGGSRRVFFIRAGQVLLEGLDITNGAVSVSRCTRAHNIRFSQPSLVLQIDTCFRLYFQRRSPNFQRRSSLLLTIPLLQRPCCYLPFPYFPAPQSQKRTLYLSLPWKAHGLSCVRALVCRG